MDNHGEFVRFRDAELCNETRFVFLVYAMRPVKAGLTNPYYTVVTEEGSNLFTACII